MPDLPSFDDLFRIGRDTALQRQSRLALEAIDREGSDANALTAVSASMGDEVVSALASVVADGYASSARGDALARLAYDRYGLVKKGDSPGVVFLTFAAPAPTAAAFTLPQGHQIATADRTVYLLRDNTVFPAGATTQTVTAQSQLLGAAQQVRANALTNILSAIPGAPSGLTVTNAEASFGADNAESDASLLRRIQRFWVTARRGTLDALETAALAVPGVATAVALETLGAGAPARHVYVIVSDAYTESLADLSTVPPAYQTQSSALAATIAAALEEARPAGIPVSVLVAQVVMQPIMLALAFTAGVDTGAVAYAARAAVVAYVNSLAAGETLTVAGILDVLRGIQGLVFANTEVVSPAGDVIPTPLQAIRTSLALTRTTSTA